MQSPNTPYMARVDQLRFFAAAIVVLYHGFHHYVNPHVNPRFPLLTVIDEGHMGVSIFMVLSGFILAVISNGRRIAYGRFVQNRILRIYPLYVFIMFLAMYVDRSKYTVLDLLSFILPVNNIGGAVGGDVALQMWTIAIEFQFYLIFPFLMLFIERYGLRYLLWLCILCVVIRAFIFGLRGTVQDLAFWTLFGRLDQFLIGMAMGVFHTRQPRRFQNPAWLVAGAAVALTYSQLFGDFGGFYGNANAPTVNSAFWIFWPSLEGMSWAAFVLPYVHCRFSFGSLLEKCLAVLGKYSFSIYSLHLLIMFSALQIMKTNGILLTGNPYRSGLFFGGVIVLPATIALSALSYKVIEEPFLSMRVRYVKEAEKIARA